MLVLKQYSITQLYLSKELLTHSYLSIRHQSISMQALDTEYYPERDHLELIVKFCSQQNYDHRPNDLRTENLTLYLNNDAEPLTAIQQERLTAILQNQTNPLELADDVELFRRIDPRKLDFLICQGRWRRPPTSAPVTPQRGRILQETDDQFTRILQDMADLGINAKTCLDKTNSKPNKP
jgi:hypothetical protein